MLSALEFAMNKFLAHFVGLLFVSLLSAQDLQNRTAAHITTDITERWFVAVWSITNLRTQTPNNTNLFVGIGYRGKAWWLEGMVQKQWNANAGLWSVDARFRKQLTSRFSLYVEPSVLLPRPAFYEFVILDALVWEKLTVGAETENVHRQSKQSIAMGPRVSYALGERWGFSLSTTLAYRLSPTGKDEARVYLVLSHRVKRKGRK
jgi:hypothetical protein